MDFKQLTHLGKAAFVLFAGFFAVGVFNTADFVTTQVKSHLTPKPTVVVSYPTVVPTASPSATVVPTVPVKSFRTVQPVVTQGVTVLPTK